MHLAEGKWKNVDAESTMTKVSCIYFFSSSKYKVTKAAGRIFYCTLVMIATENATKYSAGVTCVIHLVNQSKSSILCVFKCITTVV